MTRIFISFPILLKIGWAEPTRHKNPGAASRRSPSDDPRLRLKLCGLATISAHISTMKQLSAEADSIKSYRQNTFLLFGPYKVQTMRSFSKKLFCVFLHHLIEHELLITKKYFLALANTSFRSKNTTYSKHAEFFEKHIFCQNVPNFLLRSFIQIQHQELSIKKFLHRL